MTREQAINSMISHGFTVEQAGEIIKAVTDKLTTKNDLGVDCIDRNKANEIIESWAEAFDVGTYFDNEQVKEIIMACANRIDELPSVTPQLSVPEVTALAEWTAKLTKASEDAYNKGYADGMKAQAEPKTGHWILDETDNSITCDKCGCLIWANDISNGEAYYCPNCGAKMESEET